MGGFDAGSIDGRIELDTSPFRAGLDAARADAEEFERTPIRKRIEVDDAYYKARLDELRAMEQRNDIDIPVHADTAPARREIDRLRAEERMRGGGSGGAGGGAAGGGAGGALAGFGMAGLIGAGLSVAPGLAPFLAGSLVNGAALTSGFAQFGLMAELEKQIITTTAKSADAAVKAKKATADQEQIVKNLNSITSAWNKLGESPAMMKLLSQGTGFLSEFIPKLQPIVNGITNGLLPVVKELDHWTNGPEWARFEKMVAGNAQSLLPVWLNTLGKTGEGLIGVMEAVNPELTSMTHRINDMAATFARWGQDGGAKSFFDRLNAYTNQFKPQTTELGHNLLDGLGHLLGPQGLANPTLVNGALSMLNGIFGTLAHADMRPLVSALSGIQAFEKSIGSGLNQSHVIPDLLNLIGTIGRLGSQVNWKLVGDGIDKVIQLLNILAKGVGAVNSASGGMLGDVAGIAADAFLAKWILTKVPFTEKIPFIGKWFDAGGSAAKAAGSAAGGAGRAAATAAEDLAGVGAHAGDASGLVKIGRQADVVAGKLSNVAKWATILDPEAWGVLGGTSNFLPDWAGGENNNDMRHVGLAPGGGFFRPADNSDWVKKLFNGGKNYDFGGPTMYFPRGNKLTGQDVNIDYNGVLPGTTAYSYLALLAGGKTGIKVPGLTQEKGFIEFNGNQKDLTAALKRLTTVLDKNGRFDPLKALQQHDRQIETEALAQKTYGPLVKSIFSAVGGGGGIGGMLFGKNNLFAASDQKAQAAAVSAAKAQRAQQIKLTAEMKAEAARHEAAMERILGKGHTTAHADAAQIIAQVKAMAAALAGLGPALSGAISANNSAIVAAAQAAANAGSGKGPL
ncbi:MAG: hypothetical protein ACM3UO_00175 [Bacillota bacterium]